MANVSEGVHNNAQRILFVPKQAAHKNWGSAIKYKTTAGILFLRLNPTCSFPEKKNNNKYMAKNYVFSLKK